MDIEEIANKILRKYETSRIEKLDSKECRISFGKFSLEVFTIDFWSCRITISLNLELSSTWTLYISKEAKLSDARILDQVDEAIDYIQRILLAKEI